MNSDTSDITDKDFYGAVDRFVTNTALAGLALVPSVFIILAMPWRMLPLIQSEPEAGRDGLLLAPGLFFLLSNIFSILGISLLTLATQSTVDESGDVSGSISLGPDVGMTIGSVNPTVITAAWQTGEFNAIMTTILPLFGICVLAFASTVWLKYFVGDWWTLRTAVRTGFYLFGGLLGFVAISVAILFRLGLTGDQVSMLSGIISLTFFFALPWVYFWIFKTGGQIGHLTALGAALLAPLTTTMTTGLIIMLLG